MNVTNRNVRWYWNRLWRTAVVVAVGAIVMGSVVPVLILAHNPFPPSQVEVIAALAVTGTIGIVAIRKLRRWLNG